MEVPEGLSWWRSVDGGAAWLAALPGLAAECAGQWDLRLGRPFEPATISLVVPAERRDGTPAVLKITYPEAESEHDPVALAHWGGEGAVRLLEADAERAALLIERLAPARSLWTLPEEEARSAAGRSCTPSRGAPRRGRTGTRRWSPARAGSPRPRAAACRCASP